MLFDLILLTILIVMSAIQLLYYLLVFRRVNLFKANEEAFSPAVSVIVCGFNEANNFEKLIPKLLEQNYSTFEIVIVNDQSNDHTKFVLKPFEDHPLVKIVTIPLEVKKNPGKKFALSLGIKAAKYEYLLLTDADCEPKNTNWIACMSSGFSSKKEIVLGYGGYEKRKGFLNKLVRFDTLQIALQYFSFALISKTYMGVGRNLAYKKSLFFENKGFASHLHIPSGDDDLFIREVANKHNTTIVVDKSSHTTSEPKTSYLSWIKQKTRHFSTSTLYSTDLKILLGLFSLSQFFYWFSFIFLIVLQENLMLVSIIFLVKSGVQYFVYFPFLKKMEEKDLALPLVILDLALILFNIMFSFLNLIKRKKSW